MFLEFSDSIVNTSHILHLKKNNLMHHEYEIYLALTRGWITEVYKTPEERDTRFKDLMTLLLHFHPLKFDCYDASAITTFPESSL